MVEVDPIIVPIMAFILGLFVYSIGNYINKIHEVNVQRSQKYLEQFTNLTKKIYGYYLYYSHSLVVRLKIIEEPIRDKDVEFYLFYVAKFLFYRRMHLRENGGFYFLVHKRSELYISELMDLIYDELTSIFKDPEEIDRYKGRIIVKFLEKLGACETQFIFRQVLSKLPDISLKMSEKENSEFDVGKEVLNYDLKRDKIIDLFRKLLMDLEKRESLMKHIELFNKLLDYEIRYAFRKWSEKKPSWLPFSSSEEDIPLFEEIRKLRDTIRIEVLKEKINDAKEYLETIKKYPEIINNTIRILEREIEKERSILDDENRKIFIVSGKLYGIEKPLITNKKIYRYFINRNNIKEIIQKAGNDNTIHDLLNNIKKKLEESNNTFIIELIERYLFSWDDVPKNNTELIKFLKDDLKIEWAENAEIKKSDDNKTINVTDKNNNANLITIKLNKAEKKINLEITGGKSYEYILKEENSKLNIYMKPLSGVEVDEELELNGYILTLKEIDSIIKELKDAEIALYEKYNLKEKEKDIEEAIANNEKEYNQISIKIKILEKKIKIKEHINSWRDRIVYSIYILFGALLVLGALSIPEIIITKEQYQVLIIWALSLLLTVIGLLFLSVGLLEILFIYGERSKFLRRFYSWIKRFVNSIRKRFNFGSEIASS